MVHSMTGFARLEANYPWGQLMCEIRSVNHRYLEPNLRLPDALRALEGSLRDSLRQAVSRGKVDVSLYLKREEHQSLALNHALAQPLIALAQEVQQHLSHSSPINPFDVLRWPGVLQAHSLEQDTLESAVLQLFRQTLQALQANRQREGAELASLLHQRLDSLSQAVASLSQRLPQLQALVHQKLQQRLAALAVEVDPDRLAQELVYLAHKADVAEELDRLNTHISEVRHCLNQKEPVGRRLDFLMQELNREANTLSSKANHTDMTQTAVELKVLIEQMREQVQNIE